jgi:endonuclease/exonuclease/phosphatase family metal-dependent hydrolase
LLVLLQFAGCGKSDITTTKMVPTDGNVTIDAEPDSLDGPWVLTGPEGLTVAGRGDTTLVALAPGPYHLTWGQVADWIAPFAQRLELIPGEAIGFEGLYTNSNPFLGREFGTVATFEVATWNLEHFPKRGLVTVDQAARALQAMDVDVVALQEIEEAGYFLALDDRLGDWTGVRAVSAAYNANLAFLYRVGGDWVTDSVGEILTGYNREFPRAPYVLQGRFQGVPVVVINNHFKCCGDNYIDPTDEWDEEVRRRDAGLLLDQYVRTNFPDQMVIIVGDMNDSLTDAADRNVFNVFLDDPDAWRFVDLAIAQGPSGGWSYPGWPSHLDHILVTAALFPAVDGPAAEVAVVPLFLGYPLGWSGYDRDLSDHLPVALKIVP